MDLRKLHVWEPVGKINGELHLMGVKYPVGSLQLKFEDDSGIAYIFIYDRVVDGRYVWSCRFSEEWTRGDLSFIASEARKKIR
ncbi:hypothetical protein [Lentibacillus sp. Marseille-P4043]|uniref:hypothetical protein n=1 Tax=Lentibacillus sp. Marseille-P4043 TaxID=2040293 RepID=UPI000D0BB2CD|nr:hypothetical protein [Lentibacillus sp. Marseille-P4043]